jgi:anti-sigma factor RsiW
MLSLIPEVSPCEPDDVLEAYVMGRIEPGDLERLEIHLLFCEACQAQVIEEDAFVGAIRAAVLGIDNSPCSEGHRTRTAQPLKQDTAAYA